MIVGFFHPNLMVCGGAEWVAINIINILRKKNYKTLLLTNKKVNQNRIHNVFGCKVNIDYEIVCPLDFFPLTDIHNVYTDSLRTLILNLNSDLIIDTYSNSILPGVDLTYIHYPHISARIKHTYSDSLGNLARASFFIPYLIYEKIEANNMKRKIFSNSKYTANAIRDVIGLNPHVLYPPLSQTSYINPDEITERNNIVVTISRLSLEKQLEIVPLVAKLTHKKIRFLIIGLRQSEHLYCKLLKLIEKNDVSDRVEILTDISREKLQQILRTSKVLFHPTYGEHFGVSIAEAMASGCIPIVHNSGGPVEFVPRPFRYNSYEEAAKIIEKAIFHWSPEESRKMITIAQSFNVDKFSTRFLELFKSHIQAHESLDKKRE